MKQPTRTLLDLSRSHAAGQLDFASYRQQRRSLIRQQLQAVEERTLPASVARVAAPERELTGDRTRDFQPTPALSLAAPRARRRILVGVAVAALVTAVLAGGLYLTVAGADSAPAVAPAVRAESPLLGQITGLLRHGEFSAAQLSELEQAWQRADEETRRQLRGDHRYTRLLQQLSGQVQVLEALDPTGADPSVTARIGQLVQVRQRLSAP